MDLEKKLHSLKHIDNIPQLVSTRAKIQYNSQCTRPDLCAAVQVSSSDVSQPTPNTFEEMRKIIDQCLATASFKLTYVPLHIKSLSIVLFTDASFANTTNSKSQLGFVVLLKDGTNAANIVHYGSSRCQRVTCSVMASEIHGLLYGFDQAYVAQQILQETLDVPIPIDAYVDSKTLFNVIAKQSSTTEKRLQIDICSLKESHARNELRTLGWIPESSNIADALTKPCTSLSHPIWNVMNTNSIHIPAHGWVTERH